MTRFFLLSKALDFLLNPLLVFFVLLLLAWRLKKWRRKLSISAIVYLFLMSTPMPFVLAYQGWIIEGQEGQPMTKHYDYAVVLGGMTAVDGTSGRFGFNANSDRILQAVRLLQEGHVDRILISGGSGMVSYQEFKESEMIRDYLVSLGVPTEKIVCENQSNNTYENVVESIKVLEKEHRYPQHLDLLLITSAGHMRRSLACFHHQGYFPDHYNALHYKGPPRKGIGIPPIIPNAKYLDNWSNLLHEWIGYTVYNFKGYL